MLAATLLLAAPAWPQAPAAPASILPPIRELTLAETLDLAARQNLDLAAARLRRPVMEGGTQIAKQIPNPIAGLFAARDTPHESLVFVQPLEVGGQRGRRIEVARQEAALADLEIASLERQVRREVRQAFYGVMAARDATAQRGRGLALARRIRDAAQARFDAGDVPQLEVTQADLEVARAEADLTVQQQEEKVALTRLNALLGEPSEMDWATAGSLEDSPPMPTMAELIARASESNAELAHLGQQIKVEQSRGALLRAERAPAMNLEFGSDFNAPGEFNVGARGGFTIELPIFTRKQGELAQSAAILRVLEGQTTAASRMVAARVETAYHAWMARKIQVDLFRSSVVPAARRLAGLAEESYRAGKANLLTVLDAQRNVQLVERDYRESLVALQAELANLEETVGATLE